MPVQPNRRQASRTQAARDQIVQSALAVFALKGYGATSMNDICLAAGISKGGLYHHFASKAAVLCSVVKAMADSGTLFPLYARAEASAAAGAGSGRVLVDVWAEGARDEALREQIAASYRAEGAGHTAESALAEILRMGTLIQLLTRGDRHGADEAARRLGIERAA